MATRKELDSSFVDASGFNTTLANPVNAPFFTDVPFGGGTPGPGETSLSRRAYTYDPVGNVLSIIESGSGATTTSAYLYDPLDRLLQATVTIQTATSSNQTISNYTYGATGNLLTSPAGAYFYDGFSGGTFVNPHAATAVGLHTPQAAPPYCELQ